MKTKVLFLLLLISISISLAQQKDYPTQKSLSAYVGKGELSYLMGLGYNQNLINKFNIGVDAMLDVGTYKSIPFRQIQLLPAVHYRFAKVKRFIYFKVGGGPLLNYSTVDFITENGKKPHGLNVGLHGSVLADIYISDHVVFFASYKFGWLARSLMGSFPYFGIAGIKFNFE